MVGLKGYSPPVSGGGSGGGTTVNKGTAVIDFGAFPGSNEADVTITGQTGITSSSLAQATFRMANLDNYSINDHAYAQLFTTLSCTNIVDGVGFTIMARSSQKLQGRFNLHWTWL